MRCTISRMLCLTLALLCLLPCASASDSPVIVFSSCPSTAFRDPFTQELYGRGAGLTAICGQHRYILPGMLTEDAARDYISRAEAALAALSAYGAADRPLTLHLTSSPYACRVEGDTLYMGLKAFQSMDYVTALAQLVFGREVNYGLLYAVSCEVSAQLGLPVEEVPAIGEALTAFQGEGIIYADMNYACFIAPYADERMQGCVRALARDFTATLTAGEKATLLTGYTNEQFYRQLNAYLTAHRLPLRQNAQLWSMSFYPAGPSVLLCWESDYAIFAVTPDYDDLWDAQLWYGTEGAPLVSSYADLLCWAEHFEGMLSFLQNLFAPYTDFRKPCIVFDSDNTGILAPYHAYYTDGFYLDREHTIYAGSCEVVDHEYVHALISSTSVNADMNEILAYAYSYALIPTEWSYDLYQFSYDYSSRPDKGYEGYDARWPALMQEAAKLLGHTPDCFNPDDLMVLIDLVTLRRGHADPANLTEPYSYTPDMKGAKISYWRYLLRTYGEDAALSAALSDDPLACLGADWATLERNWILWLEETYGRAEE